MSDAETTTLYADDNLRQRAEKIVRILGYRGAVGNQVLEVLRVLETYEALDRTATVNDLT